MLCIGKTVLDEQSAYAGYNEEGEGIRNKVIEEPTSFIAIVGDILR